MSLKTKLQPLIDLTRINRPTGIWLLFIPCLFGLFLAQKTTPQFQIKLFIFLFFIGAVVMRSAGCIINDIVDRKLDKKVKRTKSRPIANKTVDIATALSLLTALLLIGLTILLQFNTLTIKIGVVAFALILLYPFSKRFTNYPQIILGITFNLGVLMAYSAVNSTLTTPIILIYLASIIWTVIYDTIYAYQDIEDDLKIGIKSSAIQFGNKPQKIFYSLIVAQASILVCAGLLADLKYTYYIFVYFTLLYFLCQIKSCDFKDSKDCLNKFKSNIWVGILIFISILLG